MDAYKHLEQAAKHMEEADRLQQLALSKVVAISGIGTRDEETLAFAHLDVKNEEQRRAKVSFLKALHNAKEAYLDLVAARDARLAKGLGNE